jgi:hypothetical protein
MIIGRMLGWLATAVTAVAVAAWLVVSLLVAGGPGADVLQLVAPNNEVLDGLVGQLPALEREGDDADDGEDLDGAVPADAAEAAEGQQDDADDLAGREGVSPTEDDSRAPGDADAPDASSEAAARAAGEDDGADDGADGETTGRNDADGDPDNDAGENSQGDEDAADAAESAAGGAGPDDSGATAELADGAVAPSVNWPDFEAYDALLETQPTIQTTNFDLYAVDGGDPVLAASVARWAGQIETFHDYVTSRAGALSQTPVRVLFDRRYEARCPARGLASPGEESPYLVVFVDEETSDAQVRAVLAHEIAHHVFASEDFVGDGVLTEGLANWAAGAYALAWQGFDSWDDAARAYLRAGNYVSVADDGALTPREGEDCIARRDRIYNVRAAFVSWLIERHGLDLVRAMPERTEQRLNALSGERMEMAVPDYEAATGRSLTQLESAWLRELLGGAEAAAESPDSGAGDDGASGDPAAGDGP